MLCKQLKFQKDQAPSRFHSDQENFCLIVAVFNTNSSKRDTQKSKITLALNVKDD